METPNKQVVEKPSTTPDTLQKVDSPDQENGQENAQEISKDIGQE